jgi:hypothetical protein
LPEARRSIRRAHTSPLFCDRVAGVDYPPAPHRSRQWVLTTPFAVRRLLALRPDALTAAGRIFVEEIARWQKQKATARGTPGGETGSVTFVQRFDSTLGSFVHFHVVALDGVFTRKDGPEVVFHEGPAPSRDDLARIAALVDCSTSLCTNSRSELLARCSFLAPARGF